MFQKANQRHAEFRGRRYGQTGRRPNGGYDGNMRHNCFLHQLKTSPTTEQQYGWGKRKIGLHKSGANEFIQGIVPAHIFSENQQPSIGVKQSGGM